MEVITSIDDYILKILNIVNQQDSSVIKIATYNLYVGKSGSNKIGQFFELLKEHHTVKTHIKVGRPIESKTKSWKHKIGYIRRKWPHVKIKVLRDSHVKMTLIAPSHCIIGSHNFADSNLLDVSVYINDRVLYDQLENIYKSL